jgi:hypothetical protein
MPELSSWDVISGADQGQLILAVDFPAVGRPEASFADLAEKMGSHWAEYCVLQTVPPDGRVDRGSSGQDYLRPWVEEIWSDGRPVAAVLGYCAGGVHAAAIAGQVGRWQRPAPAVVLFDPQVDAAVLADEMCVQLERMLGSLLPSGQAEEAGKKAAELAGASVGDLFDLADSVVGLFRQMAAPAFDRLGLSVAGRTQAVSLFQSFMSYLAVTAHLDPGSAWKSSAAVLSAEYVTIARQDPAETGIFGRMVTVDASHAGLLRSEATVQPVLEQLKNNDDSSARLEAVRSIWRDVLDVSEVDDDVAFLDAGGNSLLLVALVEKLSDACGRMIKTRDVLRAQTIKGQAGFLAPPSE